MEWISVDERLPDELTLVFTYYGDGNDTAPVMAYVEEGRWIQALGGNGNPFLQPHFITHWMPLPPKPTE